MRERDRRIIADLERFRVLTRDQIAAIHFSGLAKPTTAANAVLKRLRDRGYIEADTSVQPYLYRPAGSRIKASSAKTAHFLEIANTYIDLIRNGTLMRFEVEPKPGNKGEIEPDIFAIWSPAYMKNGAAPFFIEVQRSASYSRREFDAKLKRYERFKAGEAWRRLDWQKGGEFFPYIWIISAKRYDTNKFRGILPIIQTKSVGELIKQAKGSGKA